VESIGLQKPEIRRYEIRFPGQTPFRWTEVQLLLLKQEAPTKNLSERFCGNQEIQKSRQAAGVTKTDFPQSA
jgi:hypothetical protein